MLAYAYQSLNESSFQSMKVEEFVHTHDLLAAILTKGVSNQIKRGLNRNYVSRSETIGHLRGKIDITSSVKQHTMIRRRMNCQFEEFSQNTLLNQILKTTMMLLLRHGEVKRENKQHIRKLLHHFESVSSIDLFQINWGAVSYHRNNVTYKMLINICYLVIKGLLLTTENGEYRLANYLDDQQMHRLYEKFVLGYYQKEYPHYAPKSAVIDWAVDDGVFDLLPMMKSDITLKNGQKTLVIDTKYYSQSMQKNSLYNSMTMISSNLYQIFTYVKNADRNQTGLVSGVLLYAKTDESITPNHDYSMNGNKISVKTLDLGADFSLIKDGLNELIESFL